MTEHREQAPSPDSLVHGLCYPTALALHREIGWPIGGLIVDHKHRSWLPHLVHAYLIAPDGRAFDARGFHDLEELREHYIPPYREAECRNLRFVEYEDEDSYRRGLRWLYMGASTDPGHRFYDPEFDENELTDYDRELDRVVPLVSITAFEILDLATVAEREFPSRSFAA